MVGSLIGRDAERVALCSQLAGPRTGPVPVVLVTGVLEAAAGAHGDAAARAQ